LFYVELSVSRNFLFDIQFKKPGKLRVSILKRYAIIFLVSCNGFTIYNYKELSKGERWGLVEMIGLGFGIILFFIDIALHNILESRWAGNSLGLAITIYFDLGEQRNVPIIDLFVKLLANINDLPTLHHAGQGAYKIIFVAKPEVS